MVISRQRSITQKEVRERYLYFPFNGGLFNRIKNGSRAMPGYRAGRINQSNGYVDIHIKGCACLGHRLAWLYVYGYTPENGLDHKNGVKDDNNIANLREATQLCNMQNSKQYNTNKSGFVGVSHKTKNTWQVNIQLKKKGYYLGLYPNKLEAALARLTAEVWCQEWNCNHQNNIVKQIKAVWPDFDNRSIL